MDYTCQVEQREGESPLPPPVRPLEALLRLYGLSEICVMYDPAYDVLVRVCVDVCVDACVCVLCVCVSCMHVHGHVWSGGVGESHD